MILVVYPEHWSMATETIRDISSWLVYDKHGAPDLVGLEYRLPEGTVWTLASSEDDDFHRILSASGVLFTGGTLHEAGGGRRETGGRGAALYADSRQRGAATFPGCEFLSGLCRRRHTVLLRETFRDRRISRNPL